MLGCLAEKQLTTPQLYPLTGNAVIAACNQTTNREPIVSYGQGTVRRSLLGLRQQGLALLGVLALRGPQTTGELRARTERLHAFASLEGVESRLAPGPAPDATPEA